MRLLEGIENCSLAVHVCWVPTCPAFHCFGSNIRCSCCPKDKANEYRVGKQNRIEVLMIEEAVSYIDGISIVCVNLLGECKI